MNAVETGPRLPPPPEFTPADIAGNLAEAQQLRCIGQGQPIKASWLCLENLSLYRSHGLAPDLPLVATLEVLTLCYTDDIKRGKVDAASAADDALGELAALGGIPQSTAVHWRCVEGKETDPLARLKGFRVLLPEAAAKGGDAEISFRTRRMGMPIARIPGGKGPLRADAEGCVEPESFTGAAVLVPDPVRRQARFEALYLQGIVCMSQALRIERSGGSAGIDLRAQELPFLVEGAWWMRLAILAAPEAAVAPDECHRRARAKCSMLIRRVRAGRHFEMATLGGPELLE